MHLGRGMTSAYAGGKQAGLFGRALAAQPAPGWRPEVASVNLALRLEPGWAPEPDSDSLPASRTISTANSGLLFNVPKWDGRGGPADRRALVARLAPGVESSLGMK